ncbi:hypothetical protein [Streptomyces sp. CB01881]|uniref:hypothetical protein n=1 Tax=Streptomyces sp. CB01881 TaxID=2078691 RepID=UPI000CDC21DE|nr:hypothetical protein [Streptomyces sp. CB01881]AUY50488.1 hypothetical protein C2142_17805 [Streptomyces sp. CB01881]TYC73875.1 hypothetical protein EH183_17785 [Streptomyces sp. CB01881]
MSWFAVGDSTDDHFKTLSAGNAALGLWVRCGAYASAHLTDGVIPGAVAAKNGTASQVRKLVAAGLWHAARHTCPKCPQVREGDFVMHDYLDANPSRRQVQERRRRAAEKKRQQRGGGHPPADDDASPDNRVADRAPATNTGPGQGAESPGDRTDPRARPAPALPSRREGVDACGEPVRPWGPARRHPLPDGFEPDEAALLWAAAEGHLDRLGGREGLAATTEAFVDWHRGRGTQGADWQAMWRKWVREQRLRPGAPADQASERPTRPAQHRGVADAAQVSVAERFASIERRIALEDSSPAAGPRTLTLVDALPAGGKRPPSTVMPGQRPLMAALPGGDQGAVEPADVLDAIAEHGQANAVAMYGWRQVAALLAVPDPATGGV